MAGALFLCVLALLALALVGAVRARAPGAGTVIYGGTLLVSVAGFVIAGLALGGEVSALWLPIGLRKRCRAWRRRCARKCRSTCHWRNCSMAPNR